MQAPPWVGGGASRSSLRIVSPSCLGRKDLLLTIPSLSSNLALRHGKDFSRSLLSWSVVVELLKIDAPIERAFYEQQAIRENWTVRELQRQKKISLFSLFSHIAAKVAEHLKKMGTQS